MIKRPIKKELDEKELDEILSVESFQITMHFSIFKRNPQDLTYSFEHIAFLNSINPGTGE